MVEVMQKGATVAADETARAASTSWDRQPSAADHAITEAQDILAAAERRDRLTHRDAMIVRYAPLVKYVVGRLAISLPAVLDYDDLLGYGALGLIDAVDRYDPARLVKFETYAITRIRGYIIDHLRALDWIPRSARQRGREIERTSTQLEQEQGRPARRQEIAAALGLDLTQVAQAQADASCTTISLDVAARAAHDGSDLNLLDMIEDAASPSPAVVAEQNDLRLSLRAALVQLPERERHLISLYYGERLTLKEISHVLSISESRVCQLHARATARLRSSLDSEMTGPGRLTTLLSVFPLLAAGGCPPLHRRLPFIHIYG